MVRFREALNGERETRPTACTSLLRQQPCRITALTRVQSHKREEARTARCREALDGVAGSLIRARAHLWPSQIHVTTLFRLEYNRTNAHASGRAVAERHSTFRSQNFQIPDFKIFRFQISKFSDFRFQNFQISDFKIFRFQISKFSDLKFQNFQISDFKNSRSQKFRNFSTQLFFEDEFPQSVKK